MQDDVKAVPKFAYVDEHEFRSWAEKLGVSEENLKRVLQQQAEPAERFLDSCGLGEESE